MKLAKQEYAMRLKRLTIILTLPFFVTASVVGQPTATLIKNVTLFDGENISKNIDILFKDGVIQEIAENISVQLGMIVINGTGKTIIPPMVNAHLHVADPENMREALQAGVFAVLDMFAEDDFANRLRKYNDSIAYARFYSSNLGATAPGEHGTQFGVVIPTISDSLTPQQFVTDRVKNNADFIKIVKEPLYKTLSREETSALIQESHKHSKIAVAHITKCDNAVELASQGIDGFAHIWYDKIITDTQLDSMADNNLFIIPTLSVIKGTIEAGEAKGWSRYLLSFEDVLNETKRAYERGILILAGTDAPNHSMNYGNQLYEELIFLAQAGVPVIDVIKAATTNAYTAFSLRKFGLLRKNGEASFLLIEGEPFERITDIKNNKIIWKKGRVVEKVQSR